MLSDVPEINLTLAQQLIHEQFPQWSGLSLDPVASAGTDNALFRLGEQMVLRLPYRAFSLTAADKEKIWLPILGPALTLKVPIPIAQGKPTPEYPFDWAIYPWLEGEDLWHTAAIDLKQLAVDIGKFVVELRQIRPAENLGYGKHNFYRGGPLIHSDKPVRDAIAACGERIDQQRITSIWQHVLAQPTAEADYWIHGDLHPGNLLAHDGKLSAVIDFGLLGVGDPACDLMPAWNLLDEASRVHFKALTGIDEACWIRGQGWALRQALMALPYYWDTNPTMVAMSQHIIAELLSEYDS